ncbi:MAG: phosphoribosylaminoimidazolesuccinocarboxamide synthase [Candidatus Tectomicrobia bacterium]|uniref:Phosphoribosylaminoimidazole-succinocarboxamide synthase n=1 Tax=Tectimicrobiota bacterium TaxID=2528274 RepID=A0A932ZTN0_UNCTE|nr:phosphoribosylaminoimidazolesuccinocarboxamide synthase [Candidatus Tectomicrobia bacterium]
MECRGQLYEGKAKIVYATGDPAFYIQYFKDDATAFNAKKRGTIESKGIFNNHISARLFQVVEKEGVPTHFVRTLSDREMLVKKLDIIKVEVVLRNIVAGNLAKRMGVDEGRRLPHPIIDLHLKNDALDDPMINEDTISAFGLAAREEVAQMRAFTLKVNQILQVFFGERNVDLVDFKLEFGRCPAEGGKLLLGDEITPDGCRLWEKGTGRKLDKDRFRRDLGQVEEAYAEVERIVTR